MYCTFSHLNKKDKLTLNGFTNKMIFEILVFIAALYYDF